MPVIRLKNFEKKEGLGKFSSSDIWNINRLLCFSNTFASRITDWLIDLWTALKVWSTHPDRVLSTLSMGMVNRNIFKVEISTEPFSEERKEEITRQIGEQLDIPLSEAGYFISTPSIEKNMYDPADDSIDILYNDGSIKNIAEASDMLNISLLSKKVKKYYLCYQRLHR